MCVLKKINKKFKIKEKSSKLLKKKLNLKKFFNLRKLLEKVSILLF